MACLVPAPPRSQSVEGPFLSLQDVRALTASSRHDGMRVETLSSLLARGRTAPSLGSSDRGRCPPLEALAGASAALGRAAWRCGSRRADLRTYQRVLDVQLRHAHARYRPGLEHTAEFKVFVRAAGAYLRHLRQWVPEEPDLAPPTERVPR